MFPLVILSKLKSSLPTIRSFVALRWKYLVAGVLIALAFSVGHCTAPPKVQEKVVDHVVVQTQVVTKTVEVAAKDTTKSEQKVIERVRTVTVKGQCEETTKVTIGAQEHTAENTTTAVNQTQTVHETKVETKTVTPYQPQWRVGALVGVEPLHLGDPQLVGPFAFGLQVERRILGPVWAGAFGLSSGTVGLSLSMEF